MAVDNDSSTPEPTPEPPADTQHAPATTGPVPGELSAKSWQMLAVGASIVALVVSALLLWQLSGNLMAEPNIALTTLQAVGVPTNGGPGRGQTVDRAPQLALVLNPPRKPDGNEFRLTVSDEDGDRALGIDGLLPRSTGDFTLLLRTRPLRREAYRLLLEERTRNPSTGEAGDWAMLGEFALRLAN